MIVIDTDMLVSALNNRQDAIGLLEPLEADGEGLATTSINVGEVLRGYPKPSAQRATAERLLKALAEIPFGPRAARRFGSLMHAHDRMGKPLATLDAMVAAATMEASDRLVTRNKRDHGRTAGLELVDR